MTTSSHFEQPEFLKTLLDAVRAFRQAVEDVKWDPPDSDSADSISAESVALISDSGQRVANVISTGNPEEFYSWEPEKIGLHRAPFPGRLGSSITELLRSLESPFYPRTSTGCDRQAWLALLEEVDELLANHIDPPTANPDRWLTLAQVARGLGWFTGTSGKRGPDSMRVSRIGLDDNGESGRQRRIDMSSVLEYCRREGLDWNEGDAAGG